MPNLRVTKEFSFEMAHALQNYDGECVNIHGHTYHLSVTIIGPVADMAGSPGDGMVVDFGVVKKIVQEHVLDTFDHALVLHAADKRVEALKTTGTRMILTPYQPTAENLILDFVSRIQKVIGKNLILHSVSLRETATSFAEWYRSDNPD